MPIIRPKGPPQPGPEPEPASEPEDRCAGLPAWVRAILEPLGHCKQPQPEPQPPPPAPPERISKSTPFREIGAISAARMCEVLRDFPLGEACEDIHRAVGGRALPVAQAYMESTYGRSENAQDTRNALGLMQTDGRTLMRFTRWADGFVEWARRMDDPAYKGGVYRQGASLEEFIVIYVGGPDCWTTRGLRCANGESWHSTHRYLDETVARLNRYFGIAPEPQPQPEPAPAQYDAHEVAGSNEFLLLPKGLRFRQQLTPRGPNRSGARLNWTGTTQHTTNNVRAGADAAMHASWQANGTPGHPDGKIGVHFYVDDEEVVQTLPVDEQGAHSGDWRNQQHVAVELCVNADGNLVRRERHAVALQAGLLHILGKTGTAAMHPHTVNASGHCPRLSMPWGEYERRVDAAIGALKGAR